MTFRWPHSPHPFSFDIGGIFHQGPIDGDHFVAECKKYTNNNNNQGAEHRSFLAKCYVVQKDNPHQYDHFMWITWHPFMVNDWSQLNTVEYVQRSVIEECKRVFGCEPSEAVKSIDIDAVQEVANKLWLIVLSDKQEELVITPRNRGIIYGQAAEEGVL